MPAELPVRCSTLPTLRQLVWGSSESLACMPFVAKEASLSSLPDSAEQELLSVDGSPRSSTSGASFGPSDATRRPSEDSRSDRSDPGAAYTHDPYSFGGPTYLPPSPSLGGGYMAAVLYDDPSALGYYISDLPQVVPRCAAHRPRPHHFHCGPSVLRGAPGLLPLPAPPAVISPDMDPATATPQTTETPTNHGPGHRCPCATCASPPVSPDCGHPRPWRRLRAKRGFTFYACRDCGTKWRAVTPSHAAAALVLERDP